jgi:hypothetical protein
VAGAGRLLPSLRPLVGRGQGPLGGTVDRGAHHASRVAQRRFRCWGWGRTFTDLPARQRVTRRFPQRLFERVRGGAAHAKVTRCGRTTRYQVVRAFRAGAGDELAVGREPRPARRLSLDEAHHRRGR